MMLADVLRALSPGAVQGGTCRDTDPLLRLTEGLPCSPVEVPHDPEALPYRLRTAQRRAVLEALGPLCYWHLLLVEIPADSREITVARRELHVRLEGSQTADDLAEARRINT